VLQVISRLRALRFQHLNPNFHLATPPQARPRFIYPVLA
jgi:hypothetical protein